MAVDPYLNRTLRLALVFVVIRSSRLLPIGAINSGITQSMYSIAGNKSPNSVTRGPLKPQVINHLSAPKLPAWRAFTGAPLPQRSSSCFRRPPGILIYLHGSPLPYQHLILVQPQIGSPTMRKQPVVPIAGRNHAVTLGDVGLAELTGSLW
jgi:hypothetical protein